MLPYKITTFSKKTSSCLTSYRDYLINIIFHSLWPRPRLAAGRELMGNQEVIVRDTLRKALPLGEMGFPLDEAGLDKATRV